MGFQAPPDAAACWDCGLEADGTDAQIQFQAIGDNNPAKCTSVDGTTVPLTLDADGSSTRGQSF